MHHLSEIHSHLSNMACHPPTPVSADPDVASRMMVRGSDAYFSNGRLPSANFSFMAPDTSGTSSFQFNLVPIAKHTQRLLQQYGLSATRFRKKIVVLIPLYAFFIFLPLKPSVSDKYRFFLETGMTNEGIGASERGFDPGSSPQNYLEKYCTLRFTICKFS